MVTTRSQVALATSTITELQPLKPTPTLPLEFQEALAAAVQEEVLVKLLVNSVDAHAPKDPRITALSPESVTVSYKQPVREYWFKPLDQAVIIRIAPHLPEVPKSCNEKWAKDVAAALKAFVEKDEVPITTFIAPSHWQEFTTLGLFLGFTLLIVAHLIGVSIIGDWVFTTERRFNIAVAVHCAVLVKRSQDVRRLGDLLEKHWKGGRKGRMEWVMSSWLEGWRAVDRFRREVARVRFQLSIDEKKSGKESKKRK
ncbi:hypothetical protein BZA77DRAFT_14331 [Pyronema omphalodes]|nr:hypothetical protein BZA77DRAFT_14331 [Pyronema omphalodes]